MTKVTVEVTQEEYEFLQDRARRLEERSGRMSLRIPHDLYAELTRQSETTGVSKSEIVVNALRRDLSGRLERSIREAARPGRPAGRTGLFD